METNTSYVKNEPTVGMNFFENIPPAGVERNEKRTDLPPVHLRTDDFRQVNGGPST